jgi:uncharacterized heparinase superfamily protein
VWFRLHRPAPDLRPAPKTRPRAEGWQAPARRRPSLVPPARFCFLNETHDLDSVGWDGAEVAKLWAYNLHYFDDLNAEGAAARVVAHGALIARWIAENPPGAGTGWEPYPTSLRIVNWIKWALSGGELPAEARDSLSVQARWLAGRIEWHLLGNHLYANAKALAFAGAFFSGAEADGWLAKAGAILAQEMPEQFLADGGQFERSPMYHALALEDLLDLLNLDRVFPGVLPPRLIETLRQTAGRARTWLAAMSHPDGEIALFNDAAIGIAPAPAEIDSYARRLGFPALAAPGEGVVHLAESGYVRLRRGPMVAILDVGPVGPDYLPGHAHADTLSFELSLAGRRMLVNSGTSVYGLGPERLRQRGTAAHNSVAVAGQDSSEVWGGFRVARRARPFDLRIEETQDGIIVACSHDGYRRLPGAPVHRRTWRGGYGNMHVADRVIGGGASCASYWRAGVGVSVEGAGPFRLASPDGPAMTVSGEGGAWSRAATTLHPEFGVSLPSEMLVGAFTAGAGSDAHLAWDVG